MSIYNKTYDVRKETPLNNDDTHLKGYMFDSLVYRFKDYQNRLLPFEVDEYKHIKRVGDIEAKAKIKARHERDLMRFISILDEGLKNHD